MCTRIPMVHSFLRTRPMTVMIKMVTVVTMNLRMKMNLKCTHGEGDKGEEEQ